MSYASMFWDEVKCDFPGCDKEFDKREGKRVALVKKGEILAFCAKHCDRLESEGVPLRVLAEINNEREEAEEAPFRREQARREKNFINDLKKK